MAPGRKRHRSIRAGSVNGFWSMVIHLDQLGAWNLAKREVCRYVGVVDGEKEG